MKKNAIIPKNIRGRSAIIKEYTQYLKLEKNLSPNTYDAYLTDLEKLLHYLDTAEIDPLEVTLENLQHFMAGLHDVGIHPRSQARILSGVKSFFKFLVIADYRNDDPAELLEGPKIGFKLPEVLTVEEIDRINNLLDDLPPNEAEIVRMKVVDELSFVEISHILSLPQSTAKSRFYAGMKKLREKYFTNNQ